MLSKVFLGSLLAVAFAAPIAQNDEAGWQPAEGSVATCDKASDKIISFTVGPQKEDVLNDACAAMMPGCAYQERLASDVVCAQVLEWPLDGPKNSTQHANVEDATGNKLSGWNVQFSVTPASQTEGSPGVFWTREECYGYFDQLVSKQEPDGCFNTVGSGVGSLKVGGSTSLKDTVFDIKIVKRA
ncbi:hypothetical protein BS50DRAFT_607698 [Corynespora cassiicola Philippines]|uniref:Ecp2 effector protein domain-containing protein n=1 Tax=Corynespora cassiicola Philippines TaxID=1448308 RepID=A0A2T2P4W2_CORCC|nr:hypothetical protein BS50DRAFT_607698 [Corynespora cassiicola Philippines]